MQEDKCVYIKEKQKIKQSFLPNIESRVIIIVYMCGMKYAFAQNVEQILKLFSRDGGSIIRALHTLWGVESRDKTHKEGGK